MENFKRTISATVIILVGLFFYQDSFAACTWAGNVGTVASPYDNVDVQGCVTDAAVKTGDVTILIPATNVNWDTAVSIDMSAGWANVTSLTIKGAGATTIINDIGTNIAFNNARLFQVNSKLGKKIRITGMTLNANTSLGTDSNSGLIYVSGNGTQTRIDTIAFNLLRGNSGRDTTGVSLHEDTGAYGVIDNCTFNVTGSNWGGSAIKVYGAASGKGESIAWVGRAFTPGTANAWYIENNTFTMQYRGNDYYDAYRGARVVFRYNNLHGASSGGHGNDSSGAGDGVHTQEVYNNTYDNICGANYCNGGNAISWVFMWRGGTGVTFNNVISNDRISRAIVANNYRGNPNAEGYAKNTDNSRTTILTSNTSGATVGHYLWNQNDMSSCKITTVNPGVSITCSAGLTGGTKNYWSSGDHYMAFYYYNADGGCDGLSRVDKNVTGQQGWICKQQIGSTYDGGYAYKPIYSWNNTFGSSVGGLIEQNPSNSTRDNTYQSVPNQTYFNCNSAADCKSKNDALYIPGFGYNQGWTYTPYACPHPLTGLTGGCDTTKAGTAGYNTKTQSTLFVTSDNGTVTSNPSGINCGSACYANFDAGTWVTLNVAPKSGYTFAGWSGGGCSGTGTCTVSMASAQVVTANYAAATSVTSTGIYLSVAKTNSAGGTITANDGSINCGTTCKSYYSSVKILTLTVATSTKYTFSKWSGACAGQGTTCTLNMDGLKSTKAYYVPK